MQKIAPLGPVYQAGTLSGNPVAVAAGLATLKLVDTPGFQERISRVTEELISGLKNESKKGSAVEDLGCSIADFKVHLESLFQPGMTWDNYGKKGWEIDHIRPCASFDMSQPDQVREAWLLSNLQPLWRFDNGSKGANNQGINYRNKNAA